MKKIIYLILPLLMASCIKNDIPLPVVELYITNIEGEGFKIDKISNNDRSIHLTLDETTPIDAVKFNSVSYSPSVDMTSTINLANTYDLRMPQSVTLSYYQDYVWTISAEQSIERYFTVEGQIGGKAVIDEKKHRATVLVSQEADLKNIVVTSLKLGPEGITEYDVTLDELTSFDSYRVVNISYNNTRESWKLFVEKTDVKVAIASADARATTAHLTASGEATADNAGFRFRKAGDEEWQEVSGTAIEVQGGQFTATINDLTPDTAYEFVAYINEDLSEVVSSSTEKLLEILNSGFEQWSFPELYNGKKNSSWFPYPETGARYWDSGNPGATTLGESNNLTTPSDDVRPGSDGVKSAKISSRTVVKLGAGSIFTGTYLKTVGVDGIISMGQPFTSRPVGLKGWIKYNGGTIDKVGKTPPPGVEIVKDETKDQGSIFIALGTWTPEKYGVSKDEKAPIGTAQSPLIVDTRDQNTFFDKNGEDVVAYGELILTEDVNEWTEFEIKLNYNTLEVKPTHIIIVASSSRYGDYFTGSTKSYMSADDFELIY